MSDKVKKIYMGTPDIRREAVIELKSALDAELVEISAVAKDRYINGLPIIVRYKGAAIKSDLREPSPEDARIVLAANARRAALHGLDAPQKTALTNPDGDEDSQLVSGLALAIRKMKERGELPVKVGFADNKSDS